MLRADNVKTGKFFKKWHDRASLIDTGKTKLVIEEADSENVPSCVYQCQISLAVPEFEFLFVEDLLEEPEKERTSLSWLTQAFSPLYNLARAG